MNQAIARAELARFGALSYAGFFLLIWPLVLVWLLGEPGRALLDRPLALPLITVLAAWPIPVYCFLEDPRTRVFELALPIAARDLHLTRLTVLGLVMLAPIAGALCSTLTFLAAQGLPLAPIASKAVDILGATALLAVACVVWQPAADVAESSDVRVLHGATLLLGTAVVAFPPPWIGLACVIATACLFPRMLRGASAPAAPLEPLPLPLPIAVEPPKLQTEEAEGTERRGIPPLHWLLLRTTFLRPSYLGSVVTFLGSCAMALLSGPLMTSVAVLPFLFAEAHASVVLRAFTRFEILPIERSQIALYIGAPSLAAMLALAGLGAFPLPGWGLVRDDVTLSAQAPHVRVPAFAWLRHKGRATPARGPLATAPWGEAVQADVRRIPDAGVALYNPYDVTQATSLRMLGWQLSRAARELYGVEIPPEKLLAHVWAHDRTKSWNPNAQLQGNVGDLRLDGDVSFAGIFGPSRLARFAMALAWISLLFAAGMLFTFASVAPPAERTQVWRRWVLVVPALLIALNGLGIGLLTLWIGGDDLGLLHGLYLGGPLHRALGVHAAVWLLIDAIAIAAIAAFVLHRVRTSELGWIATGNRSGG